MSKSQAFCKLIIFPPQHPSPALSLSHTHTHSLLLSVGEGDFSQTDRGERQHSFTDGSSGIRWNLYKTDFDYMPKHLHVCVSVFVWRSLCLLAYIPQAYCSNASCSFFYNVCVCESRDKKRRMKRRV